MQNEYYYLNEIEIKMEEFLDSETSGNEDFGWISPMTKRRMAEAAYAVLKNAKELNDHLSEQGLLTME